MGTIISCLGVGMFIMALTIYIIAMMWKDEFWKNLRQEDILESIMLTVLLFCLWAVGVITWMVGVVSAIGYLIRL